MFKWIDRIFKLPTTNLEEARRPTVYDAEETTRILSRARRAETRFDNEFNDLMKQLDRIKKGPTRNE